ncbi:TetR/AcrR family transcriptional regulator [[Clostridium] hylemonae]|uniref:TetR/AcrR family transcriptional regulator n=1 Tax=[Clostridium] hylemonae TaxID=89153 RepID=UPI0002FED081|nr:TetR/AcrR family transcriptional regulator [[Clostridium] hylemonae]QEK18473.1 HTH-type transcriptional regulator BetI [[Clostridium] hylemonae DSM 15053]
MDNKEAIIQAAMKLIEEKGERLEEITVREICKRANVGLGLVNYHFGNKDKLMEQCIECMINGTVEHFQNIREKTDGFTPFEKLEYLGNMTLDFLFEHYAVSKISVLTDMQSPKENDNTHRTYAAYLPLVAACRPDLDEAAIKRKTLYLITVMQQLFLRYEIISQTLGIDLTQKENRRSFHTQVLHDILEV